MSTLHIIRGTTPTIEIVIKNDIDLSAVLEVWVYIAQQNKVKIDKLFSDVTIDEESRIISVTLDQEDTLALKADQDAVFQVRMLLENGTALATEAAKVVVKEVYKGGVIE